MWSWPSGHVEAGERPVDAVIREVEEELVIADPRVVRHLGDVDTRADVSRWWGRRFRHGYVMHHFQLSVAAPNVAVIDHEALLVAEWRTLDQVVEAVATLPPELAEAAVKFARMAAAGPAVASAISTPAQAEKLLSPTGGVWEPIREYMEGDPSGTSARRARKGAET